MSPIDSIISKLLKQKQNTEEDSGHPLNEFAMDIEFPHTSDEKSEE